MSYAAAFRPLTAGPAGGGPVGVLEGHSTMRFVKTHGPVLLITLCVSFLSYGWLLRTPLWSPLDLKIITEASVMARNPFAGFLHIGAYFSQPLLQISFLIEYLLFCASLAGYLAVNLLIHSFNAFLVYMLVNMLFGKRRMAILAAALFAFTVGNYGKVLTTVAGLESLLLSHFYLLVLYFLIRNDWRHQGRLTSPYFLLGLVIFGLASLTRATSFSLLGCLLAYKFFFYGQQGSKDVFSRNILVLICVGLVFFIAQSIWGHHTPAIVTHAERPLALTWESIKMVFRYLTLMVFPLQPSSLVERANPVVQLLFDVRTYIRVLLTLAIISYSFFGFVFGGRALRFFIAWTYIMLLPFTGLPDTGEWLNLTHLYLTSLGFCLVLAAGAEGASGLLIVRPWRRYLPYLVPALYVILALSITYELDEAHRRLAGTTEVAEARAHLEEHCRTQR
jgi:hypothetical protein